MATAVQGLRLTARSCSCVQFAHKYATRSIDRRGLHSTRETKSNNPTGWKPDRPVNKKREAAAIEKASDAVGFNLKSLAADMENTKKDIRDYLDADLEVGAVGPDLPVSKRKLKETFLNMGEQEPFEDGGFIEDDHDDITSLAHGELEQHREWRHYARLAAWEMPLLSKLAKPFEAPTAEMPLRFRYTTYMGEQHPAEKKVVLEFSPADMPNLTDQQRNKLRKLLGVRYNPEKDTAKMSCEMYETQSQNKRYLGDLVDSLLAEARDPTDTFEDIPLDTRHHHFKPKLNFPKEWAMTDERRRELASQRQIQLIKDQSLEAADQLIDGVKLIKKALAARPVEDAVPQMVLAGKGGKSGGKGAGRRISVKR